MPQKGCLKLAREELAPLVHACGSDGRRKTGMVRRVQPTSARPGRKAGGSYGGPDLPGTGNDQVSPDGTGQKAGPSARLSAPAASGLRSRGFLSQGGSADGEAPRRARGKKTHAVVVSEPTGAGPAPRPGDFTIRAKRLPSLRDEKSGES